MEKILIINRLYLLVTEITEVTDFWKYPTLKKIKFYVVNLLLMLAGRLGMPHVANMILKIKRTIISGELEAARKKNG